MVAIAAAPSLYVAGLVLLSLGSAFVVTTRSLVTALVPTGPNRTIAFRCCRGTVHRDIGCRTMVCSAVRCRLAIWVAGVALSASWGAVRSRDASSVTSEDA